MFIHDLFSLEGEVAVVIGGGGVLAGEIQLGLAKAGADVGSSRYPRRRAPGRGSSPG